MAEQQQNSLDILKQNLIEYVKLQLGDLNHNSYVLV